MKLLLRRAWVSPTLLALLVFVVEAGRKVPKNL